MEKILFYSGKNFIFRSGIIGYLHEISQVYRVVLLAEELDKETDELIRDKNLFPKLEKIIPVRQYADKKNLFAQNKYLHNLAKNVVLEQRPDILMTTSDTHSLFELYLMRFAKRIGAVKISVQNSNIGNNNMVMKYIDMENVNIRFPVFLPLWLRLFLMNCRKYCGHILYYWLSPMSAGEMPFFGKVGHILWMGCPGRKTADYQIVFSKRDYDICVKDGVPENKLRIVAHPFLGQAKEFFKKTFFKSAENIKTDIKNITFIWPVEEIGFRRSDYSLISKKENQNIRQEIVDLTVKTLPGWKVFLKPHPDIKDLTEIKNNFQFLSDSVEITGQSEPVDKYLKMSDIIVGIPPVSTAIFTAFLQYPEKPILTVDLNQELVGDYYKGFEGIEYIDEKEKFIDILAAIRGGKYQKKNIIRSEQEGFSGMVDFLKTIQTR